MIQHSTMSRFLNFKFLLVDGTIKWCPKIEKFKFLLKRQLRWDDVIKYLKWYPIISEIQVSLLRKKKNSSFCIYYLVLYWGNMIYSIFCLDQPLKKLVKLYKIFLRKDLRTDLEYSILCIHLAETWWRKYSILCVSTVFARREVLQKSSYVTVELSQRCSLSDP